MFGNISSFDLVRMKENELAHPELTRKRKNWTQQRIQEITLRDEIDAGAVETNLFTCVCGSNRTQYRQWRRKAIVDRTRIIVICMECPRRWDL